MARQKNVFFDKQKDTEAFRPLPYDCSPSDQGKILQNLIASLRMEMSKRSVIEKFTKCHTV